MYPKLSDADKIMWKKSAASGLVLWVVLTGIPGCSGGQLPVSLGVTEGRLAPCPTTPNCVSSEATTTEQRVEPLRYTGDASQAHARLSAVLNGLARTKTVQSRSDYLHSEVRSAVFGFVDDLEFYFSPPGMIQVRSASRTGYHDFGVNSARVERIRLDFSTLPVTP